jgi:hypothetical protein
MGPPVKPEGKRRKELIVRGLVGDLILFLILFSCLPAIKSRNDMRVLGRVEVRGPMKTVSSNTR